ncbi:unnamed protein product [Leuciscus chuanchicus]
MACKKQSYWTLRRKAKAKVDKQLQSMQAVSSPWREEYGSMHSDKSSTVDDDDDDEFMDCLSHIDEPEYVTMAKDAKHHGVLDNFSAFKFEDYLHKLKRLLRKPTLEFVGEGTTGTIAKSWYSDGHSWWPPFRDLDRLLKSVRMMEAPQPDKGWTKHQVRILHESASFDNIAKKWKKACYTSDISETEMPGKRIHKKKIYTSDDEPHDTPHKKKKMINKEKVLPAPKAPLANIKTKGPVVRPLLTPSRAGKSFSNSPVVPVSLSQADEPWHEHPPDIQENTFSILRPNQQQRHQGRMQIVPVSLSQADEPWHEHPPDIQEDTISEPRPSSTHQARTQSASGVRRWSRISDQCTPVERMILETLHELDMKMNHLTSVVQSLAGRSNVPVLVVDSEDDVFPLTSMEDLDNLERQLSERGMMQKMYQTDAPVLPFIAHDLAELLKSLLRRFVKIDLLRDATPAQLVRLDVTEKEARVPVRAIDIGIGVENAIKAMSLEELYKALQGMESGKAPGINGLPVDFYKSFWTVLGEGLLAVLNESLSEGRLPYQGYGKEKLPADCVVILDVARMDFLTVMGKLQGPEAVSGEALDKHDHLLVLYYLEAIVMLKLLQRPGVVTNNVEEWQGRTRTQNGSSVAVKEHKTAASQVTEVPLTVDQEHNRGAG